MIKSTYFAFSQFDQFINTPKVLIPHRMAIHLEGSNTSANSIDIIYCSWWKPVQIIKQSPVSSEIKPSDSKATFSSKRDQPQSLAILFPEAI